jgi:hypothetical protein
VGVYQARVRTVPYLLIANPRNSRAARPPPRDLQFQVRLGTYPVYLNAEHIFRSKRKPPERHLDPLVEVALVESKRKHRKLVQNPSVGLAASDIISTSKLSPSGFDV